MVRQLPPCLGRELYRAPSGVSRVRARARGLICVSDSCSSTAAGRRGGVLRLVGMTTARKVPCTLTPRALVGRMRTIPELRCFLHARLSLFECSVLDRFRFAVDRCLCSLRSTAAVSCSQRRPRPSLSGQSHAMLRAAFSALPRCKASSVGLTPRGTLIRTAIVD